MASLPRSAGLSKRGAALWRDLTKGRDLDAAQSALLLNMCRLTDRLDELSGAVGDELTVVNDKGDTVANPILTEHRQQLLAFLQVAKTLGVEKLPAIKREGGSILDDLAARRVARESAASGS